MHTALRPYVTSGIAIMGASVIAVAPMTVPPQDLPSVEVVAVDAVRSVTADVELTALVDVIAAFPQAAAQIVQLVFQAVPLPAELESLAIALANAGVPALTETFNLFTQTIPTTAQNLIAAGKFAHLPVLAVNAVLLGVMAPMVPFLAALAQELPLPLGTADGLINESFKLAIQTPAVTVSTVLSLMAQVIDDGLSPVAAFAGVLDALSTAITSSMESIGKIVAAVSGGALPFSAMVAPEGLDESRTSAIAADSGTDPLENPNVRPAALDSSSLADLTDTATITVETADLEQTDATEGSGPTETGESEDESGNKPQVPDGDDVTPNGGTDLSDGNQAQPGAAGEDNDGATTLNEDDATLKGASGDETATTSDADTGSDEGSGDEGESSGESD